MKLYWNWRKEKQTKRFRNSLMFHQTLSTWKKNKDKIFDAKNLAKRVKVDTYDQVNRAIPNWFKIMRAENVPISGSLMKEKALYFAKELSFEDFQTSDGWLDKWKKK